MFRLSEDQRALKERARRFAAQVVAPHVEELDRTNEYPWPIVKALAAERFMGMNVPPAYGGDGRSLLDTVLVVEEMAKVCGTVARIVVSCELPIERMVRDARMFTIGGGTVEMQKNLIAGRILGGRREG